MSKIIAVEVNNETVHDLPEENIYGIFLPKSAYSSASVGIIKAGEMQKAHYHNRVGDGVEIVFVYQGKFIICNERKDSDVFDTNMNGPVYIQIPTKTIAHLKNVGQGEVRFFSVFAPALDINELVFID